MNEELKYILDLLISEGHWHALDDIAKEYGSQVRDYICNDADCPWPELGGSKT
jgi:hypothetical protein